jgi:hypothetical protein
MRLGKRYQVPNRPSHHVAVPLQEAGAGLLRTQHSRNISRHGRFFGNDRNYTGLACWHLTVSILDVGQAPDRIAANSFSTPRGRPISSVWIPRQSYCPCKKLESAEKGECIFIDASAPGRMFFSLSNISAATWAVNGRIWTDHGSAKRLTHSIAFPMEL